MAIAIAFLSPTGINVAYEEGTLPASVM